MAKQSAVMILADKIARRIIAEQTFPRLAIGLDSAMIAAHRVFGMGPERAKRFDAAYKEAMEELLKENAELDNSGRVLMAAFARAKEKMPQWHPVSKPPKENGRYYVAYEDSVSFLDYFNGKWFFPPRNGIVVEETKESILYWQPFPAPPKEVE